MSYARIGALFGKERISIYDQYKNYERGSSKNGRPSVLQNDEIKQLTNLIQMCHLSSEYPIYI